MSATSTDLLITDPLLRSVLAAASAARRQCLAMLDFLQLHGASSHQRPEFGDLHPTALTSRLAILRGLNRQAVMSVRATKHRTSEARQEIDALLLALQNLYYERNHLRREIGACEGFDHKYLSIPLPPLDRFLAAHPEYRSPDVSDHDLTIARITDEHEARKKLEEQRLALVRRKLALEKETAAKKEELGRLDVEIERWIVQGRGKVEEAFRKREEKMAREERERREVEERERERREAEERERESRARQREGEAGDSGER